MCLSVKKDAKNPFFKSDYVTLEQMVSVLTPILNEQWLIIIHSNIENGVETKIVDVESGNFESSLFQVEGITDPQKKGSCITYWKRYNLGSLFNIISERDDDANAFYKCDNCGWECKPWKRYCCKKCFEASKKVETADLFE